MEAVNVRHEIRAVSLDISRVFDTVWHPALLFKLSAYGIKANSTPGSLTSSTLVTNVWHSTESFHLLSLSRLECPKAVFWAQSYS